MKRLTHQQKLQLRIKARVAEVVLKAGPKANTRAVVAQVIRGDQRHPDRGGDSPLYATDQTGVV